MYSILNTTLRSSLLYRTPALLLVHTAWMQHIPFAFVLTELLRPNTFVELGTYQGASYCAFCEAVLALGLPTKCTAVDTWKGDPHQGTYTQEVLSNLRSHHDPRYGAFSRLLQTDFDSAAKQFSDGSIDLLHIDGFHTYEAVRHDYLTWLPKMSSRCVILFHDTAERRDDFGVWRLWEEVSRQYPAFAFEHGSGLGILAVGNEIPQPMHELLSYANTALPDLRQFFSVLGQRVEFLQTVRYLAQIAHAQRVVIDREATALGCQLPAHLSDLAQAYENPVAYAYATMQLSQLCFQQLAGRRPAKPGGLNVVNVPWLR